MDSEIFIGKTFSSYDEVKQCIEDYGNRVQQLFIKIKSGKIKEGKFVNKCNLNLKYFNITYSCKYGDQTSQSKSTGQRQARLVLLFKKKKYINYNITQIKLS